MKTFRANKNGLWYRRENLVCKCVMGYFAIEEDDQEVDLTEASAGARLSGDLGDFSLLARVASTREEVVVWYTPTLAVRNEKRGGRGS